MKFWELFDPTAYIKNLDDVSMNRGLSFDYKKAVK